MYFWGIMATCGGVGSSSAGFHAAGGSSNLLNLGAASPRNDRTDDSGPTVENPHLHQRKIETEAEERRVEGIKKLFKQTIGEKVYYVAGNCSFEKATIRCFAEIHKNDALNEQKWSLLDTVCTEKDLIYIEGVSHNEKVDTTNQKDTAKKVMQKVRCMGWEPAHSVEDAEYTTLGIDEEELKKWQEKYKACSIGDIIQFCMDDEFLPIRFQIEDECTRNLLYEILDSKNKDLKALKESELYEKIGERFRETIYDIQKRLNEIGDKTFSPRNRQMCTLLEANQGRTQYVIAGVEHFPHICGQEHLGFVDETKKFLDTKKYCILIPEAVVAYLDAKIAKSKKEIEEEERAQVEGGYLEKKQVVELQATSSSGEKFTIYSEHDLKNFYDVENRLTFKVVDELVKQLKSLMMKDKTQSRAYLQAYDIVYNQGAAHAAHTTSSSAAGGGSAVSGGTTIDLKKFDGAFESLMKKSEALENKIFDSMQDDVDSDFLYNGTDDEVSLRRDLDAYAAQAKEICRDIKVLSSTDREQANALMKKYLDKVDTFYRLISFKYRDNLAVIENIVRRKMRATLLSVEKELPTTASTEDLKRATTIFASRCKLASDALDTLHALREV